APAPFGAAAVQEPLDQPFGVEEPERRLLGAKPAPETAAIEHPGEMMALGRLALGIEVKDLIQRERAEALPALRGVHFPVFDQAGNQAQAHLRALLHERILNRDRLLPR